MQAKTSFAIHLRPDDVRAALRTDGILDESDIDGIVVASTQLAASEARARSQKPFREYVDNANLGR